MSEHTVRLNVQVFPFKQPGSLVRPKATKFTTRARIDATFGDVLDCIKSTYKENYTLQPGIDFGTIQTNDDYDIPLGYKSQDLFTEEQIKSGLRVRIRLQPESLEAHTHAHEHEHEHDNIDKASTVSTLATSSPAGVQKRGIVDTTERCHKRIRTEISKTQGHERSDGLKDFVDQLLSIVDSGHEDNMTKGQQQNGEKERMDDDDEFNMNDIEDEDMINSENLLPSSQGFAEPANFSNMPEAFQRVTSSSQQSRHDSPVPAKFRCRRSTSFQTSLNRSGHRRSQPWTMEEDDIIAAGIHSRMHHGEVENRLAAAGYNRTPGAIRVRRHIMKKTGLSPATHHLTSGLSQGSKGLTTKFARSSLIGAVNDSDENLTSEHDRTGPSDSGFISSPLRSSPPVTIRDSQDDAAENLGLTVDGSSKESNGEPVQSQQKLQRLPLVQIQKPQQKVEENSSSESEGDSEESEESSDGASPLAQIRESQHKAQEKANRETEEERRRRILAKGDRVIFEGGKKWRVIYTLKDKPIPRLKYKGHEPDGFYLQEIK